MSANTVVQPSKRPRDTSVSSNEDSEQPTKKTSRHEYASEAQQSPEAAIPVDILCSAHRGKGRNSVARKRVFDFSTLEPSCESQQYNEGDCSPALIAKVSFIATNSGREDESEESGAFADTKSRSGTALKKDLDHSQDDAVFTSTANKSASINIVKAQSRNHSLQSIGYDDDVIITGSSEEAPIQMVGVDGDRTRDGDHMGDDRDNVLAKSSKKRVSFGQDVKYSEDEDIVETNEPADDLFLSDDSMNGAATDNLASERNFKTSTVTSGEGESVGYGLVKEWARSNYRNYESPPSSPTSSTSSLSDSMLPDLDADDDLLTHVAKQDQTISTLKVKLAEKCKVVKKQVEMIEYLKAAKTLNTAIHADKEILKEMQSVSGMTDDGPELVKKIEYFYGELGTAGHDLDESDVELDGEW